MAKQQQQAEPLIEVSVRSNRAGFRRGGRVWGTQGEKIKVNAAMLAVLEAEPMLTVTRVKPEAAA
jgi:hypothetical protein